jgi:molybdopterin synthase catalytic subunit
VTSPSTSRGHAAESLAGDDWLGWSTDPLPVAVASDWVVLPGCGAVVTFTGTVRDHAEGRLGVTHLHYEAYDEHVEPRMAAVVAELRRRWPEVGRVAMLHRAGEVRLGEAAVVVAVSAPHRESAFEAARYAIDTLKRTLPIWKSEHAADGSGWGVDAQPLGSVEGAV